mmetsp:Transcript_10845/g.19822  ORF Transcript_10845/g.19822 Transcript_10845/m.19822 type:complete len:1849 (-) Transcript_10845:249-5795(-)
MNPEGNEKKIKAENGDRKSNSLEDAYKELRLAFSSVGDDIGQTYVVHGDSLLLDLFSHPLLDWSRGGQLLHFFYLAESALQKFAHRGRIFKLVFFDCFAKVWKDPSMQLACELFVTHTRTMTEIDVERFPDWECKEWKEFVSFTRPSFMLMMNAKSGKIFEASDNRVSGSFPLLQKMALDLLAKQNMDCVSMTEVSFKSSSMFGFRYVASRELRNEAAVTQYDLPAAKSYLDNDSDLDQGLLTKVMGLKLAPELNGIGFSVYTLVRLLRESSKKDYSVELAKVFLLHAFAARTLPLAGRSQELPDKGDEQKLLGGFIDSFYATAMKTSDAKMVDKFAEPGVWKCDIVDGRLFQKIAIVSSNVAVKSAEELGLDSALFKDLEAVWKLIADEAKLDKKSKVFLPIWSKSPFSWLKSYADSEVEKAKSLRDEAKSLQVAASAGQEEEKDAPKEAAKKVEDVKDIDDVADAWDADGDDGDDVADDWDAEDDGDAAGGDDEPAWDAEEEKKTKVSSESKKDDLSLGQKFEILCNRKVAGDVKISSLKGSEMIKTYVGEIEQELAGRSALTDAYPKCPYDRDVDTNTWLLDREIDDGTNPPPEPEPVTKWERRKFTQRKMRYIAYLDKYAKSLKGGGIIYRDVVVAKKSEAEAKSKNKKGGGGKNKNKSKQGGKKGKGGKGKTNMRDQIRADVEKKLKEKALNDVKCYINHAASLKTLEQRIEKLDKVLISMSEPYAVVPGLMQLLDWCVESWKIEKVNGGMGAAVRVFQMVMDIFRRFKSDINHDQFKKLQLVLLKMGFEDAANLLVDQFIRSRPEKISAKDLTVTKPNTKDLIVGLPSYRFQLMYAGHLMVRDVDSAPDDRVSDFYPDKWQRKLLDVVDKKESCLVVAPTSSGKTFVSYYAMKQALFDNKTIKRSTDRSIIVYVSPTKALVNQVAADVYARYGAVFGVMTRDYSRKLKDCEVLITIPECLETLLLSPQSEMWARCIKYVIFDEVHCLGSTSNGDVWERLLMMVRCPFIALSATLGNPEEFSDWMGRIQSTHDRKVNLIIHRTRWSDLIKYMYTPKTMPKLTAIQGQKHLPSFEYVHPCSALGTELARTGFPPDLNFSPKDCMLLYDAMLTIDVPAEAKKRVEELHPLNFFKDLLYIKKVDAQRFEKALKDELYRWSASNMKKEILELISKLTKSLDGGIKAMESSTDGLCYSVDFLKQHFMPLMVDLLNADFLPAVVFNLDREICEDLVTHMLFTLEDMEEKTLEAEGNIAKNKAKQNSKLAKMLKRKRDKKKNKDDEEAGPDDDDELGGGVVEDEPLYHVDPRFSFIQDGQMMEMGEMEWWLDRLLYKTKWSRTHPLIRALQRGIGVHHDELHRAYKDLVETLFRTKHLKVVVATSTLALGVNMPARTTVFCGDSPDLDPLKYRQMAGRAGRRGYDNIGNVVFVGIAPKKVFRLMTSSLLSLHGHFPMTPTVALRMINLHGKVYEKKNAKDTLINLVQQPFFSNPDGVSRQTKMNLRFSMQYLLEQDLITWNKDNDLQIHGAGALALHLRFAQPGNMLFVKLWDAGIFDKICSTFQNKGEQPQILQKLMLVMAHLFFRQPLPVGFDKDDLAFEVEHKSYVSLPPLPEDVQKVLKEQKASAMKFYTSYLQHASLSPEGSKEDPKQQESLPLSGLKYSNSSKIDQSFLSRLDTCRLKSVIRSDFFRLSGHSDRFGSASEIAQTVKPHLYMDIASMPVCEMKDRQLRDMPINAYAVDFLRHGSLACLIKENGLASGKAWALLKQWSYLLEDLAQAVLELQRPSQKAIEEAQYYGTVPVAEKNNTAKAFSVLNIQFQEMFNNWNQQQTNNRKKMEEIKKPPVTEA